jgi:hypothetical protein
MSHTRTGLALSVQQPWPWLIVDGFKPVENRDWPTRVRRVIGIHAGKKFDVAGYEWIRSEFPRITMPTPHMFDLGGIVGRARIVDCDEEHASPWFVGRYGFVLSDPEPLPFRACRGELGFFRPALTEGAPA